MAKKKDYRYRSELFRKITRYLSAHPHQKSSKVANKVGISHNKASTYLKLFCDEGTLDRYVADDGVYRYILSKDAGSVEEMTSGSPAAVSMEKPLRGRPPKKQKSKAEAESSLGGNGEEGVSLPEQKEGVGDLRETRINGANGQVVLNRGSSTGRGPSKNAPRRFSKEEIVKAAKAQPKTSPFVEDDPHTIVEPSQSGAEPVAEQVAPILSQDNRAGVVDAEIVSQTSITFSEEMEPLTSDQVIYFRELEKQRQGLIENIKDVQRDVDALTTVLMDLKHKLATLEDVAFKKIELADLERRRETIREDIREKKLKILEVSEDFFLDKVESGASL